MKYFEYMKTLKKSLVYILLVGMSISIHSCSSGGEPRFLVNVERDFNVENTLSPITTHFFELRNISTNLDQSLDIYGLQKNNIAGISPADAVLTTVSGLMDWSRVSNVEVYAISRVDPSKKMRIFYVNERDPGNNDELRLFNTFADLSEIMLEETIDLEVRLRTIASVAGNFRARLLFNYAVFDEI